MNFQQDNPLKRFSLFWRGLGVFLLLPVLLLAFWLWKRKPAETPEEVAAKVRYETKSKVDAAQREALAPDAVEASIARVAAGLAASQPTAVERPDQVVPGSETSKKLSEAPAPAPAPESSATPAPAPAPAPVPAEGQPAPTPAPTPAPAEGQPAPADLSNP